jgi:hypothetical protein
MTKENKVLKEENKVLTKETRYLWRKTQYTDEGKLLSHFFKKFMQPFLHMESVAQW